LGLKGALGGPVRRLGCHRVLSALEPGEIVLMHVDAAEDGSSIDADAQPRVITQQCASGYAFASVLDFV
jgi:peptidoglycan-N-acetylglucosamine deacetylase